MGYYFLSSSHLEDRVWFKDDNDYAVGMNYAAVAAKRAGVFILVFVLMSNHVHFLLYCDNREKAEAFYTLYKNLYSRHMHKKYRTKRFLRDNKSDCQLIRPNDERLEKVIAYILMNPVAANISLYSHGYKWGCGNCFFSDVDVRGKAISSFSHEQIRSILHTELPVAENWIIGEHGFILPESFIRKDLVEKIFCTPKRMFVFLRNSSKARLLLESQPALLPSFRDQSLLAVAQDIAVSLFRKESLSELTETEIERVVSETKRRCSADIAQIARVLSMSPKRVAEILSKI